MKENGIEMQEVSVQSDTAVQREKRQKTNKISSRGAQCGNYRQPLHVQFENSTLFLYPSRSKLIVKNQLDCRKR